MAQTAFNPKSNKSIQVFNGGLAPLGIWAKHIGPGCCVPNAKVDIDRLVPTVNPENALVHNRPAAERSFWQTSNGSSDKRDIIKHINEVGVGAEIEIMVVPTFSFFKAVHIVVLGEEVGLTFKLKTRNGIDMPADQLIKVEETDAGTAVGCGDVARVKGAADFDNFGAKGTASRVHLFGVADASGDFALYSDTLVLEVLTVPTEPVRGDFDLMVYGTFNTFGRSEAQQ